MGSGYDIDNPEIDLELLIYNMLVSMLVKLFKTDIDPKEEDDKRRIILLKGIAETLMAYEKEVNKVDAISHRLAEFSKGSSYAEEEESSRLNKEPVTDEAVNLLSISSLYYHLEPVTDEAVNISKEQGCKNNGLFEKQEDESNA